MGHGLACSSCSENSSLPEFYLGASGKRFGVQVLSPPVLQRRPLPLTTPPFIGSRSASTVKKTTSSIPFHSIQPTLLRTTQYVRIFHTSLLTRSRLASLAHLLTSVTGIHHEAQHPLRDLQVQAQVETRLLYLSSWTALPTINTQVPAVHNIPDRPRLTRPNRSSLLSCHANVRPGSRLRPTTFPRSSHQAGATW
jgi:hypothetical protein